MRFVGGEVVVVLGPLAREDAPGVCARAGAALEAAPGALLVCEAGGLGRPDLVTVDVLALAAPGRATALGAHTGYAMLRPCWPTW
ncbi:hypothetical protein ACU686_45370 [Yinghuangia aomiensis]